MVKAQEFKVEKRPRPGAVVYRMSGVLGETQACYEFLQTFKDELASAPARIVFDLSRLENMYSAGVGIVAASFTSARDAGKSLCFVAPPAAIARTLAITGVTPEVPTFATEAQALA